MSSKTEEAKIVDDLVQAMYAFNLNISSTEQTQFLAEMEGKLTQALATYKASVISECEKCVPAETDKDYWNNKEGFWVDCCGEGEASGWNDCRTQTLQAINSLKV